MSKMNCWNFMNCGRYLKGPKADELGVCPAATCMDVNGVHGGTNGGRACWAIAGTFCGGKVQGTEANKQSTCYQCDFFQMVRKEESVTSTGFSATMVGMKAVIRRL